MHNFIFVLNSFLMLFQSYKGLLYAKFCSYKDNSEQEGKVYFMLLFLFCFSFSSTSVICLFVCLLFTVLESLKSFLE